MKIMNRNLAVLLALAAFAGLLAGCESDSVAPHDDLPAVTAEDAAFQTAAVAYALAEVGPYILSPVANKDVTEYTFYGANGLTGTVYVDAGATSSRLYTADGAPLVYTAPGGGTIMFTLDITGTVSGGIATLAEGSGGTMTSGDYVLTFSTTGLVVGGAYPVGDITVATGTHEVTAVFDGTNLAVITVDGGAETWTVNLDTGALV
jgi:hypothetical protein